MEIIPEYDSEVCFVLPHLALIVPHCSDPKCDSTHGFAICIGWLFWTLNFHFGDGDGSYPI